MTKKIEYINSESFLKGLKKLTKKFKTLLEDLEVAKKNALELFHVHGIDNQSTVLIPGCVQKSLEIYKLRKFACKALKGRGIQSGIRIIYAFDPSALRVTFIEIYFKADQQNEDQLLIELFLESRQQLVF